MFNIKYFYERNNEIHLNKYVIVVRHYDNLQQETYEDETLYVNDDGYIEMTQLVQKHALLELVSNTIIDTSEYTWMEGIPLKTTDTVKEIEEIASYGSKEAYEASLPEYVDDFMLDMECRMAMIEMGI
ncbi:hypothetical protein FMM68_07185 [Lachnospiraceae bacterium MD329]|nr:hypothetical protein [Lachnospiraceae bacterium MD329]